MKKLTAAITFVLALAGLVAVTSPAHASVRLVSPPLSVETTDEVYCKILNISSRVIDVQLSIRRADASTITDAEFPISPWGAYGTSVATGSPTMYCVATVTGTTKTLLRAAICNQTTGACFELH